MTKLISWNVNGLRACVGKNFLDFFHEADADVFCLQETKLQAGQIDLEQKQSSVPKQVSKIRQSRSVRSCS